MNRIALSLRAPQFKLFDLPTNKQNLKAQKSPRRPSQEEAAEHSKNPYLAYARNLEILVVCYSVGHSERQVVS